MSVKRGQTRIREQQQRQQKQNERKRLSSHSLTKRKERPEPTAHKPRRVQLLVILRHDVMGTILYFTIKYIGLNLNKNITIWPHLLLLHVRVCRIKINSYGVRIQRVLCPPATERQMAELGQPRASIVGQCVHPHIQMRMKRASVAASYTYYTIRRHSLYYC